MMRANFIHIETCMIRIHDSHAWHQRPSSPVDATAAPTAVLDLLTVGEPPMADGLQAHWQLLGCDAPTEAATCPWTGQPYRRPVLDDASRFALQAETLLARVDAVIARPASPKVTLLGPVSLLSLCAEARPGGDRLRLLPRLLDVYEALLTRLAARGVTWVQLDEPLLSQPLSPTWQQALREAYGRLGRVDQPLLMAAGALPDEDNLALACELPVAGLQVDAGAAALPQLARRLPRERELSLDLSRASAPLAVAREIRALRGGRIWLAQPPGAAAAAQLGALRRALWREDVRPCR
jgi:hypothetical protein